MTTDKLPTDKLPITIRGKHKLEEELKRLMYTERPAVIKAIEEARSHGDISENAEYDAAKERQALVEGRIIEIQNQLAGAEVVGCDGCGVVACARAVAGAPRTATSSTYDPQTAFEQIFIGKIYRKPGACRYAPESEENQGR